MDNKVAAFAATPDPTFGQKRSPAPPVQGEAKTAPGHPESADLRLVIEEDQASGSYVYKTIDRRTGEVIQVLPRAKILRMRDATRYSAGAVIRTKA